MQTIVPEGFEFHTLAVILSGVLTLVTLYLYRKTRVRETLIFALYPFTYGLWQGLALGASVFELPTIAKTGYLIGALGVISLFVFGERIHRRTTIMEVPVCVLFGSFLFALSTDTLTHPSPITGEILFGFGPSVTVLGMMLTTIVGVWMIYVAYLMHKRTLSLDNPKAKQSSFFFMIGLAVMILTTLSIQMSSLFLVPGPLRRSFSIFPTLGPLFILIALWVFRYIPYLLTIDAEALTIYHSSGIPVYHRTLSRVVTHDSALLTGALSAINAFTKEVVSGSELDAILMGDYIFEHYRAGDYTLLLITLSRNPIVCDVLTRFIKGLEVVLKEEDPSETSVGKIVEDKFRREVPVLFELSPPE